MSLYYIVTHQIFFWIAVALAIIGNLLVWASLEKIFTTNKPSSTGPLQRYYDELDWPPVQRASHYGVVGVELKLIALVVGGLYAASYPGRVSTLLLIGYLAWLLIMTVLVMVGVSRVKRWWRY